MNPNTENGTNTTAANSTSSTEAPKAPVMQQAKGWFGRNKTWLLSTGSVAFGAALGYGAKAALDKRAASKQAM